MMKKNLLTIVLCLSLILTLFVPAFAAEAVPSIEQKGVPEVVETSDPSITLVPLYSAGEDTELREAYEEIKEVDLGDDVVIRDVFDVEGDVDSGSITVDVSKYEGELVVLEYVNGEWEQIPAERIVINDDGTATIILDELCPLAFATGTIDEGEGECPFFLCRLFGTDIACNITKCLGDDGCNCWIFWLSLLIIIIVILSLIGLYIFKKTKKQEDKAKAKEEKAKAEARARREERKKNK